MMSCKTFLCLFSKIFIENWKINTTKKFNLPAFTETYHLIVKYPIKKNLFVIWPSSTKWNVNYMQYVQKRK